MANWRTADTSFQVTWSAARWLPKEERSTDYYVNEYRFTVGDSVKAFTYKYTTTALYAKSDANTVILTGARE